MGYDRLNWQRICHSWYARRPCMQARSYACAGAQGPRMPGALCYPKKEHKDKLIVYRKLHVKFTDMAKLTVIDTEEEYKKITCVHVVSATSSYACYVHFYQASYAIIQFIQDFTNRLYKIEKRCNFYKVSFFCVLNTCRRINANWISNSY